MDKGSTVGTVVQNVTIYLSDIILLNLHLLIASLITVLVYLIIPFNLITMPAYFIGGTAMGLALCASHACPASVEDAVAHKYTWRMYLAAYRKNFRRALVPALLYGALLCVLFADITLIVKGKLGIGVSIPLSITAAFLLTSMFVCFLLIYHQEQLGEISLKEILWRSLILSYQHVGVVLIVLVTIVVGIVFVIIIPITLFIVLGVGTSIINRAMLKVV
ncbi:hypothetical protein [Lacticaseibacillus jixiensis]|uniref:hypothetical protein n=1 Tax=Lacticaseibacillus jixiensis TaxID=3231926 RepID=UPI0036F3C2B8